MAITKTKTTYKLKSGATVTGTAEEIAKVAKAMGEKVEGFYTSETNGLVKVSEMATPHLRNAVIKRSKEVLETVRKRKLSDKEFLNEYLNMGEDKVIIDLFIELNKRVKL